MVKSTTNYIMENRSIPYFLANKYKNKTKWSYFQLDLMSLNYNKSCVKLLWILDRRAKMEKKDLYFFILKIK